MYLVFFIFAVIKIVIFWKFMVETKGKTEVEIREEFNMICNWQIFSESLWSI